MINKSKVPNLQNQWRKDAARVILKSYEVTIGHPLLTSVPSRTTEAERLFKSEYAVLAHGTEKDPIFFYGNLRALTLFEYEWEELLRLPSRLSAEQHQQSKRGQTMDIVSRNGYIKDYSAVRISKSGRRFTIENATIWNLKNECGIPAGQAALFKTYSYI